MTNHHNKGVTSVEYAHVYVGDAFPTTEQVKSVATFKKAAEMLDGEYSACLLVDDFHQVKGWNGDIEAFIDGYVGWLEQCGAPPTHVCKESKYVKPAKQIIDTLMDEELAKVASKKGNICLKKPWTLLSSGKEPSCQSLVAAWYAHRLGWLDGPSEIYKSHSDVPFIADELVIVLPKKYKSVEEKALNILSSYVNCLNGTKQVGIPVKHCWFDVHEEGL